MTNETASDPLATPVLAIQAAIGQFRSQSAFRRALMKQSGQKISHSAISQWVLRGKGASAALCPDIEAISTVPCEKLCPGTNWSYIRKTTKPPVFSPRIADNSAAVEK